MSVPVPLIRFIDDVKDEIEVQGRRLPLYEINGQHYFQDSIPVDAIERDEEAQPRAYNRPQAEKIADSIKKKVLMQPILLRWNEVTGRLLVTEGQHRWKAFSDILELDAIPAIVYVDMNKHIALLCGLEANAEDRARALTGGDLARKTHALIKEYAELVKKERPNDPVNEARILNRMGVTTRGNQRKFLLGKITEDIRETPGSRIAPYIGDRQSRSLPLTAGNFMGFLSELVRTTPVMDNQDDLREDELINLRSITDLLVEELYDKAKWNPEDPDKQSHRHAINVSAYRPVEALGYFIAKAVDQCGGAEPSIGACFVRNGKIDWDKLRKRIVAIVQDPIWDQPHVTGCRNSEELRGYLGEAFKKL